MEQLRTMFVALGKIKSIKTNPLLSENLRRKVIETMLYMINTFPFCSISHQQAILILNSLKEAFDYDDLSTLKNFVKKELTAQSHFNFTSGHHTSGMNMGQIIQIAFELRNITQQALDDESSSAEEEDDVIAIEKRDEMANWFKFCKEKIEKIEKVWNRKLDERHRSEDDEDLNDKDDYNLEQDFDSNDVDKTEKRLEQMLANITNRRRENVSSVKGGSFVA